MLDVVRLDAAQPVPVPLQSPQADRPAWQPSVRWLPEGGEEQKTPASYLEPFDGLFAAWSKHDALVEAGNGGGAAGES